MNFTKITIGEGVHAYDYWIAGIYKIVSYRKGKYHAYFIQEWCKNWGDCVCKPPSRDKTGGPCWLTFKAAKQDCEKHAQSYQPSAAIATRAREIKQSLMA